MHLGDVIAGRFTIERRAGVGGMGTIYRAHDAERGAPVALKVLERGNPDTEARFAREARVLSELHHPRIVGYVAHGVAAPSLAVKIRSSSRGSRRAIRSAKALPSA